MFDTHSDYALNKVDKEAIICPCATGEHIRLIREDFSSAEEFLRWKKWSDENYHEAERAGRKDDSCFSFEDQRDTSSQTKKETSPMAYIAAEQTEQEWISSCLKTLLSETQYRRMCLYYLEGKGEAEIASIEGVNQSSVSRSIRRGAKVVERFFGKFFRGGA